MEDQTIVRITHYHKIEKLKQKRCNFGWKTDVDFTRASAVPGFPLFLGGRSRCNFSPLEALIFINLCVSVMR